MALMESKMVPLGTEAVPFSLPGTDGQIYSLESFREKRALIIVIMCNHCPYVKAVFRRLVAIQRDYAEKGVQLVGINPNDSVKYREDSFENMKKVAAREGFNFPYLRDESQETARAYGAVCTPDVYLYDAGRKLVYRGRIDDNWQDESRVTKTDLRDALDALLNGRKVGMTQHPSMGCSIKWK